MDCLGLDCLTLVRVLDCVASVLTLVLVVVLAGLLIMVWVPSVRKRLSLAGQDFKKDVLWPLIVAVVTIVVTHAFAKAISESETRAKYVELGVGIMRSEPRKKGEKETAGAECPELSVDEEALRTWAYKLIDTYSYVRMEDVTKKALICRGLNIITGRADIKEKDDKGLGTGIVE